MAYLFKKKKTGVWYIVDSAFKPVRWKKLGVIQRSDAKECLLRYQTSKTYLRLDLELPPSEVKFCELADEYIKDIRGVKDVDTVSREQRFLNHLCKTFGDRYINEIKPREIEEYFLDKKYKANSIHNILHSIKSAYKYAVRCSYLPRNPMEEIRKPKIEQLPPRHVDPKLIEKILKVMEGKIKAYYLILYYTGMRPGEALRIQARDIASDGIVIRHSKTKRFRVIPLHPKLKSVIEKLCHGLEGEEYLFPAAEGEGHQKSMKMGLRRACAKAGVKGVSAYTFRHTFATQVLKNTHDLRATQTLLGHSKSTMTERYAHALPEALKKAIEGL